MSRKTIIRVDVETREQLRRIGRKGETYDDIIKRILQQPQKE